MKNVWLRAAVGGAVLIALTLLLGTDYNGAGMDIITRSLAGEAKAMGWVWKILFTAVTIGCGFQGGEVVPSFFIGAAFGCVVGPLLGLDAGFAAGIGLICVFCGAVNCPMASILLSIELFGAEGLSCFALACGIGVLFVEPYIRATFAELYQVMREKAHNQSIAGFDELPGFIPEEQ